MYIQILLYQKTHWQQIFGTDLEHVCFCSSNCWNFRDASKSMLFVIGSNNTDCYEETWCSCLTELIGDMMLLPDRTIRRHDAPVWQNYEETCCKCLIKLVTVSSLKLFSHCPAYFLILCPSFLAMANPDAELELGVALLNSLCWCWSG